MKKDKIKFMDVLKGKYYFDKWNTPIPIIDSQEKENEENKFKD